MATDYGYGWLSTFYASYLQLYYLLSIYMYFQCTMPSLSRAKALNGPAKLPRSGGVAGTQARRPLPKMLHAVSLAHVGAHLRPRSASVAASPMHCRWPKEKESSGWASWRRAK